MTSSTLPRRRPSRRFRSVAAIGAVAGLLAVAGLQLASAPTAGAASATAAARGGSGTGFTVPFSGPSRYESLAPTLAANPSQINQPLGQAKADAIAAQLGLNKAYSFTEKQFLDFVSGGGNGGKKDAAKLIDGSIAILTNTLAMLYRSPYLVEAAYGYVAQQSSGDAQLVTNRKGGVATTVGMSMAPALWLVNFILIYTLNPRLAAAMPAYWTPIPPSVAWAIYASQHGQVKYADYRNAFPQG
jgi:hypothetical protein